MNGRWALLALGLGLATGTTIPVPGAAQQVPRDTSRTRRDTVVVPVPIGRLDSLRVDSTVARDTTAAADTLKMPIAPAPAPISLAVGEAYTWDREALFASGALTLLDLLERLPGITGYRTAFLLGPELAAYQGSFGRIRVFLDGIELDPLDPRLAGQTDLSALELWTLEQLTLERAAGELRVHARTWRVDRTVASTRTDVST
ncbi:MAG TPA: hypothetical protein VFY16_06490, partial [Gemmatimonadaceae bacterium]|nr:hypothetical protein [Gemmatimonadaceae bacterium]